MALQMEITAEGLAKFRSAMETGALVTLTSAELYGGFSGGAVSGNKLATMTVRSNNSLDPNSNVYRFSCQDKDVGAYTAYSGKVLDADGVVVAIFHNNGAAVATKEEKAEVLIGCEIHFEDSVKVSDVVNMGDASFYFNPDDATTEVKGVIELATEAEAKAGTDTKRAITPKTLDAVIKTHSDVVHRSGAETIAGNKTFTGSFVISKDSPFILVSQNDVVKGTKPPTSQYMGLAFVDSEGQGTVNRLGLVETKYMADGGICLSLSAYKPENGSTASAGIEIIYPITGSPYINVPAPANGDSSNKIATTAWVKAVADKLLPLAGGTMTGGIKHQVDSPVIKNINSAKQTIIAGGTTQEDGGTLFLFGKDNNDSPGIFVLRANNGTLVSSLFGYADGKLQWGGKNIVRSVNGTAADAAGNVVIKLDFLPLTGGEITGPIKGNASGALMLLTGDNNFDGASLQLYKKDHATYPGRFYLRASTKSSGTDASGSEKTLVGFADGTLTWDSKHILNNSFQMPSDSGAIILTAGTSATGGALFRLYGKSHSSGKGQFNIVANDGTNAPSLIGKPDGTLTWGGKDVIFVDHGEVAATENSGRCWWRKYSDGWIEQGGKLLKGSYTQNMPLPFSDLNYTLTFGDINPNTTSDTGGASNTIVGYSLATTYFKVSQHADRNCHWYACGY